MAQNRESFLLNRSEEFSITTGAENRTDLSLQPNPDVNKGPIITTVLSAGDPVFNAMVKVLSTSGDPIDHSFTNTEGFTNSIRLSAGTYIVTASAPGYITSTPVVVNLPSLNTVLLTISLEPDPRTAKNSLFGLVLDQQTGNPIGSSTVVLTDSEEQTIATTQTDSDGEYLLCLIENGSYTITAEKTGYQPSSPLSVNVTGSQIAQTDISLTAEVISEGTVQGFIKDQEGNLLSSANVALYSVSGTIETLVQETSSNGNGFYLFGNVTPGNYLVKANVEVAL